MKIMMDKHSTAVFAFSFPELMISVLNTNFLITKCDRLFISDFSFDGS